MNTLPSHEISQLLNAWGDGDQAALEKLIPLVHHELHKLAGRYMRRENPGHTLQTSALVNEAYLKLVDQKNVKWQNRAHFFGVAAQLMRRILVDHARGRARSKRGNYPRKVSLEDMTLVSNEKAAELIALDEALNKLATIDPLKSRIVEMKIFCGSKMEEISEVTNLSVSTIEREWRRAKAWLHRELVQ